MFWTRKRVIAAALTAAALVVAGCAPGSDRFTMMSLAGFWAGLWHGFICVITFIVSLFVDGVRVYEVNNSGHLYDLGFVLGAMIGLGGLLRPRGWMRARRRKLADREIEEIARKVEVHVRRAVKSWADGSAQDDEWADVGRKVEEKIRTELRKWAES